MNKTNNVPRDSNALGRELAIKLLLNMRPEGKAKLAVLMRRAAAKRKGGAV